MRVTQYFTTKGTDFLPQAEFLERPVYASQHLIGVKALRRTSKIITNDFLGFGVAGRMSENFSSNSYLLNFHNSFIFFIL